MKNTLNLVITLISVVLYVASLFYPVFQCESSRVLSWQGYHVLLMGWVGLFNLVPHWLFNFLYYLVIISNVVPTKSNLSKKSMYSEILIIGAATAPIVSAMSCEGPGTPWTSTGLATGGYLWIVALVLGSLPAIIRYYTEPLLSKNSGES